MANLQEIKNQLKTKLIEGIEVCFDELGKVLSTESGIFNEYVQQRGRYNSLTRQIHGGLIAPDHAATSSNQINEALIYLIDRIKESDLKIGLDKAALPNTESSSNTATITGSNNIIIQGVSGSQINIQSPNRNPEG